MSEYLWNTPEERARRAEQTARRAEREAEAERRMARENAERARRREQELSQEYERRRRELERRMAGQEQQHKSEVAALGTQVRALIRQQSEAHAKELQTQRERMGLELGRVKSEQNALRAELHASERRTAEQMKALSRSVDERLAASQADMDQRMNALSRSIDRRFEALEKKEKNRKEQAEALFAEIGQSCAAVLSVDPDGFYLREAGFASEWEDNEQLLSLAKSNLTSGAYEAALSSGQSGLLKLWKANGIAALTRQELLERAATLSAQAEQLQKRFDDDRDYAVTYELDGETVTEDCDLDEFTLGAWGRRQNALSAIFSLLKEEKLTGAQLDDAQKTLAALAEDLPVLEKKARALLIRSRVTEDVANRVHYVLTELSHWQCESGDHADGNETAPVSLRYTDEAGNELDFVLSGGESSDKVRMYFRAKAADGSESHGLTLSQGVADLLRQQGVEMDDVQASKTCKNENPEAVEDEIVRNHAGTKRWMNEGLRGAGR